MYDVYNIENVERRDSALPTIASINIIICKKCHWLWFLD